MTNNERTRETLIDLVKINNDRVTGYEKAADQIKDTDSALYTMFMQMAGDSRKYASELNTMLQSLGESNETSTTFSGKLYRTWMDVKNMFTGSDRKAILESCEFGEDAAQEAYLEALEPDNDERLHADAERLIRQQQQSLKQAHDIIKRHRDMMVPS